MNARLVGLLVLVGVLLAGAGVFFARPASRRVPTAEPTAAPPLRLQRLQPDGSLGETVDLADFRGKAVAVNFWATWCPPCDKEIPDFVTVAAESGDDVVILLVNRGEPREQQVAYLRDRNLLEGNRLLFLNDSADAAYRSFNGFGMPVTAFVTKSGTVSTVKSGLLTLHEMRTRFAELRSQP